MITVTCLSTDEGLAPESCANNDAVVTYLEAHSPCFVLTLSGTNYMCFKTSGQNASIARCFFSLSGADASTFAALEAACES